MAKRQHSVVARTQGIYEQIFKQERSVRCCCVYGGSVENTGEDMPLKPVTQILSILLLIVSLPLQAEVAVQDDTGRKVLLSHPADRIISLAPHITEQLYAIGAGEQLVGAVDYSNYPEAAKKLPRVGGYSRLDLETILSLRPDLIVGWVSGNDPRQLERLEQLGMTVYRSEPRELEDIAVSMQRLGILSGHAAKGAEQAKRFMQRLTRLAEMNRGKPRLRVFYEIWNRPLMTINGEHLISDVIHLCGGENVFAKMESLTPTVSQEAVIASDPDLIVASGMAGERPEWLDEWRRWHRLKAVRNGQLHFIPPDFMQRATPRLLLGAEQLCSLIHRAHTR
jgi:iron complex transport system substrate-binding protein